MDQEHLDYVDSGSGPNSPVPLLTALRILIGAVGLVLAVAFLAVGILLAVLGG